MTLYKLGGGGGGTYLAVEKSCSYFKESTLVFKCS